MAIDVAVCSSCESPHDGQLWENANSCLPGIWNSPRQLTVCVCVCPFSGRQCVKRMRENIVEILLYANASTLRIACVKLQSCALIIGKEPNVSTGKSAHSQAKLCNCINARIWLAFRKRGTIHEGISFRVFFPMPPSIRLQCRFSPRDQLSVYRLRQIFGSHSLSLASPNSLPDSDWSRVFF